MSLESMLSQQWSAFWQNPNPSADLRQDRLTRAIAALVEHREALVNAMHEDFGNRHKAYSTMNDLLGSLAPLKYAREHLKDWMQPEAREVFPPYNQMGAQAWIQFQPKGPVGIIGTWNAPIFTLFAPMASALAAGNPVLLKPSEVTPRTAEAIQKAVQSQFQPQEVNCILGGAEVAQSLAESKLGHLIFTGSGQVGTLIMQAASRNLTPVTLELGGKSPTVIGRSADLADAARKIAIAKLTNAGQLCVNPDVCYVAADQLEAFVSAMQATAQQLAPSTLGNTSLTSVVNARHHQRLQGLVEDARAHGVRIEVLSEQGDPSGTDRRMPITLLIGAAANTKAMHEELFGPLLVIQPYTDIQAVIADIQSRDCPLALYYFGSDASEQDHLLRQTLSGGVSVNDAMMHAAMLSAPFGGVGASGMGHYQGREGFLALSHTRTVFVAGPVDPRADWGVLPPYPDWLEPAMAGQVTDQPAAS
jgi:coniferyl-aldehyde dehydrogenase